MGKSTTTINGHVSIAKHFLFPTISILNMAMFNGKSPCSLAKSTTHQHFQIFSKANGVMTSLQGFTRENYHCTCCGCGAIWVSWDSGESWTQGGADGSFWDITATGSFGWGGIAICLFNDLWMWSKQYYTKTLSQDPGLISLDARSLNVVKTIPNNTHRLHGYIYLHDWVMFMANVGKYSSTMKHLQYVCLMIFECGYLKQY